MGFFRVVKPDRNPNHRAIRHYFLNQPSRAVFGECGINEASRLLTHTVPSTPVATRLKRTDGR